MVKLAITKRVMAAFKLGDEGKMDNFYLKQIKNAEKSIRDLKRNKGTLENAYNDEVDDINDQLTDAKEALAESYKAVTPDDVKSNAAVADFESKYWNRVARAKADVKRLENRLKDMKEEHEESMEDLNEQIIAYQERIDILGEEVEETEE